MTELSAYETNSWVTHVLTSTAGYFHQFDLNIQPSIKHLTFLIGKKRIPINKQKFMKIYPQT